ncbi:MAG TPA: NAD-dependent epimerase/dehydratase family protein [Thermoleophilaceae bacterium]|nr:NAD-dependent epimerase/dehydratase family protein [Thermoleophilaceae bacterium]
MRVVVVGASGNVGTSVLRSLADEPAVDSILGIARRIPESSFPKTEWRKADIAHTPLRPHFQGADVVVHLAWLIQPGRDKQRLHEVNVDGTARVFRAAAAAGVPAIVYASSIGAYAPGPKDRGVDESWPTTGISSSFYARHKAEAERLLDRFEDEHPDTRVVRLRPGLIFKREAASGIRRLFAGPFLPNFLVQRRLIPVVPAHPRLVFQAVHSYDIGEAYRLAIVRDDAHGAYNVAADPVLDPDELARALGARKVPVPAGVLRGGAALSYALRLQPSEPGWVDMALAVPVMDTTRIRTELGWKPARTSSEALLDLIEGMHDGAGLDTPPLEPGGAGPLRAREFASGVGARNDVSTR